MIGQGIAASPGAATGGSCSRAEAQASAARGEDLHSGAARNLTRRHSRHARRQRRADRTGRHHQPCGGHRARHRAALCVGCDIRFQTAKQAASTTGGCSSRVNHHGGWHQRASACGRPAMQEAALDDAFQTLMAWADDARTLKSAPMPTRPQMRKPRAISTPQGIGLVPHGTYVL